MNRSPSLLYTDSSNAYVVILQHRPLERDKGIEPEVREMSRRGRKNGDGNLIRMKVTDVKVKEREGVRVRECKREFV